MLKSEEKEKEEEEKTYCITLKTEYVEVMIILPMDEKHLTMVEGHLDIGWVFDDGSIQLRVFKPALKDFSIQLIQ